MIITTVVRPVSIGDTVGFIVALIVLVIMMKVLSGITGAED